MSWIYIRTDGEDNLWTVGERVTPGTGYGPNRDFLPESDHDTREAAAERVHWLNGGNRPGATASWGRPQPAFEPPPAPATPPGHLCPVVPHPAEVVQDVLDNLAEHMNGIGPDNSHYAGLRTAINIIRARKGVWEKVVPAPAGPVPNPRADLTMNSVAASWRRDDDGPSDEDH